MTMSEIEQAVGQHIGIELRVRLTNLPEGENVVVQADSDSLHLISKINGGGDWLDLLNQFDIPIVIEARPVMLPDRYPDD